jgi:calcium release-activated calcium channel protein 1
MFEIADMSWQLKCREEDLKQRALENERRAIDDTRRLVDEKAQQLKSLAHQSALVAGFSMIILVEIQIPDNVTPTLLISFSCTTALVVCLMLISMLNATFMLVAILRYDTVRRELPFTRFWCTRCESDWKLALRCFACGTPLFLLVLAQMGWVVFWEKNEGSAWIIASSCVSVIAVLTVIVYLTHTDRKWREWLLASETTLHNPEA